MHRRALCQPAQTPMLTATLLHTSHKHLLVRWLLPPPPPPSLPLLHCARHCLLTYFGCGCRSGRQSQAAALTETGRALEVRSTAERQLGRKKSQVSCCCQLTSASETRKGIFASGQEEEEEVVVVVVVEEGATTRLALSSSEWRDEESSLSYFLTHSKTVPGRRDGGHRCTLPTCTVHTHK